MDNNELDNSISSISTTSTDISTGQKDDHLDDINSKVNTNKLLNKKQQDQRTEKKQTPLEKYLADYEKTLENKSPEDLEKERNKLEQQKKMSLIASIIFAILALALLITACILLPLAPALVIAIPAAIGAITAVASGIIDYNIINQKIDKINTKIAQLYLKGQLQQKGNNKSKINTLDASIQQNKSNTKITTTEKNIANNNSVGEEVAKKNTNNIDNNTPKDKNEKKNINNNQNIQNNNKSNKNDVISNNILANKNNNINSNKNDNSNINNKKIHTNAKTEIKTEKTEINTKNISNNNSNHSAPQACNIKDDNEAANLIYSQTAERVSNGTLDLSSHPNEQEYNKFKQIFHKQAVNPRTKAHARQQMIKYEIWSQLSPESQQSYEQLIKDGKSPEDISKKHVKNGGETDWQVILYNEHLENEEKKNQSQLSAISHKEKTIEEKQQAVTTAILGQQQKNGIQLSGVGQQTGNNYTSGAITNTNIAKNISYHQK